MNLVYSEDHRLLADSAREFLAARSPVSRQRELRDKGSVTGFDLQLWQDAVALGWSAIPFPENLGGLDFGCMGLGPIFESIGSNLSASPLLSSVVLSGSLLHLQGNPQQQDYWLSAAISGERRLALALDERARHNPAQVALQAVPNADGYSLSGEKFCVIDGVGADAYLVVARVPEAGISLFLVPADAPGLSVKALPLIDSRNHAQLQLRQVQVGHDALLGEAGSATAALNIALDRARVCLAAEMLGMAEKLFAMTLDYLKTRVQFDVAIGSFQSLQHRSAQLYVQLQLARSAVMAGLAALDDTGLSDVERQRLASLAKWKAGLMALNVANETVQMHGGIGVTDELDVGMFLKRIRVAQASLGDADFHCERYADLMPAHA